MTQRIESVPLQHQSLELYDYQLPRSLIAQQPLAERDSSSLLVLDRKRDGHEHKHFHDLPALLSPGDLVVVNETRVIPARLRAVRAGGGKAEVFLVRETEDGRWLALVRPGARIRPGDELVVMTEGGERAGTVRILGARDGGFRIVEFPDSDAATLMKTAGVVPLPPYIRRAPRAEDRDTYQTVYARVAGAVAAPTAGLHFNEAVFAALRTRGIEVARLVLHVGPGSFRPVTAVDPSQHRLDSEWCEIPQATVDAVKRTRENGGRIVAVGTTTTRALEAAARTNGGQLTAIRGWVDLFIRPPYEFQVVDALVTNFHLPRSSLLFLVSALAGRRRILEAYRDAVQRRYRFYSYGDAMLIL